MRRQTQGATSKSKTDAELAADEELNLIEEANSFASNTGSSHVHSHAYQGPKGYQRMQSAKNAQSSVNVTSEI